MKFFALVFFLLLTVSGLAWNPDSLNHYKELERQGLAKEWRDGTSSVLILASISGAKTTLTVAAPRDAFKAEDTEFLAAILRRSGFAYPTVNLTSRSDQDAINALASQANFGKVSFHAAYEIGLVAAYFQADQVYIRLSDGLAAEGFEPEFSKGGYHYYQLDGTDSRVEKFSVSSRDETARMVIYWLLVVFCVCTGLFGKIAGDLTAFRNGVNTKAARLAYSKAYSLATYFAFGLAFCLVAYAHIAGYFQQLYDLQTWIYYIELPLDPLTIALLAGLGTRNIWMLLSRRVLGPNAEEQATSVVGLARLNLVRSDALAKNYQWLLCSACGLFLFSFLMLPWVGIGWFAPIAWIVSAVLGMVWLASATNISGFKSQDLETLSIKARAEMLLAETESSVEKRQAKLVLLKSCIWPRYTVLPSDSRILVTPEVIKELPENVSRFLLTHAAGLLRQGQDKVRINFYLVFGALTVVPLPVLLSFSLGNVIPSFVMSLFLVVIMTTAGLFLESLVAKQTFESDAYALRTLGDLSAAEQALASLAQGQKLPGLYSLEVLGVLPPVHKRIEKLRELAPAKAAQPDPPQPEEL